MADWQQGYGVVGAVLMAAYVVARLARKVDHVLLAVHHLADGADLIAVLRGALEAQRRRVLQHQGTQFADQVGAVAGEQLAYRGYPPPVGRRIDAAHAGRRATPDVMVQAGLVAALEHLAALA